MTTPPPEYEYEFGGKNQDDAAQKKSINPWIIVIVSLLFLCTCIVVIIALTTNNKKQPAVACTPATIQQTDFINYAVQSMQSSNYIKDCYSVKSDDYANVYMVSCYLYGPNMESGAGPAVFSVGGDPENPHTWMSVNAFAKEFTTFPDAGKTDAEITLFSHGVEQSINCTKQNH